MSISCPADRVHLCRDYRVVVLAGISTDVTVDAMPWATVRIMPVGAEQGVDAIERITPFAVPLADGDYLFTFGPDGDPTAYEETRHVAEGSRTIRLEIPGTDAKTLVDRLLSETR